MAKEDVVSSNMKKILNGIADMLPAEGHPNVSTFSYNWIVTDATWNVGMSVILQADVALGVNLPIFSVYTDRRNIAFNPQMFLEVASHNMFSYHLGPYKFHILVDLNAFKFIPFDY